MTQPPRITKDLFAAYAKDRMRFRLEQRVLECGELFGDAIDPWQKDWLTAYDSGNWTQFYWSAPKGHDKTGMAAMLALEELCLGSKGARVYVAAADRGQARLTIDSINYMISANPQLRDLVRPYDYHVLNNRGGRMEALAADEASSHGLRPNVIIVDELAAWSKRDLFDVLYAARHKIPGCRVIIITTAGHDRESVCFELRETARQNPDSWHFVELQGTHASWLNQAEVEETRKALPPSVAARLLDNIWTPGEDTFLSENQVKKCVDPDWQKQDGGIGNYVMTVDLGIANDRTAISIGTRDAKTDKIYLCEQRVFTPTPQQRVKIEDVETYMLHAGTRYQQIGKTLADPWQMEATIQKYGQRLNVKPFPCNTSNLDRLTMILYQEIAAGRVVLYDDPALIAELLNVEIKPTVSGVRVDHKTGKHDDRVVSLGMLVLELAKGRRYDTGDTNVRMKPGTSRFGSTPARRFTGSPRRFNTHRAFSL